MSHGSTLRAHSSAAMDNRRMHLEYPAAPLSAQIDDYHGETIADPFRWLEDTSSEETRAFIEAENRLADAWLEAVPSRKEITDRVVELWNHRRLGVPFERGGRWFQYRNAGLQPQPVLYVMDRPGVEGEVLVDPNAFSEDGTVALVDAVPSADGRLLAYATSDGGSDWLTWRVLDVTMKALLSDVVEWSKFSTAAWRADASGFFYGAPRRPEPGQENEGETRGLRVLFHLLGAKDGEDEVIFSAEDQTEWLPHATVTDDGRYLVVAVTCGTRPQVRLEIFDLERLGEGSVVLDPDFSSELAVAGNEGPHFFLVTDDEADRRRLVATDLSDPEHLEEVVPESADLLASAKRCGDALVCSYLKDARAALRVHGLDGHFTREIELPHWSSLVNDERGTISGHAGLDVVHFATTSFTDSGSVWSHDLWSGETMLVHPPSVPFHAADYMTERGFATSADGTRVPFFCTLRRDVSRDGEVPVLLYGYGGFNVPIGPEWSVLAAVFMERGGAYVLANLRGGGEFGRAWHDGGRLEHKQHVFDDFVAVARELAGSGLSRPERTAIHGGSNGGLLVGASLTQHPEAFGAAVAEVGVLDMLRFHKFTIGWAWTSDFGDPDEPEQYPWLRAYSPLHNIREGVRYPATLLLTGDHDDRVVPAHSFKFAAALQRAQGGDAPILLRVETSAGHGAGKPTSKQILESADVLTFVEGALGVSERRNDL
jgi:prolyl oligopeptidase